MPCARLSTKSYTLTPRIHPRSVSRLASVVAGKITSLQRKGWLTGNELGQSRRLPTFELAAVYVGCGVGCPGLVGRRLTSASVVRFKFFRSHVVYERRLCVVPARLKNDLLYARPVCVCFLPIHSGHQWTYQPGSHRRKVTQDFSSTFFLRCVLLFFSREGFSHSFPSSTVKSNFVY